MSQAPYMAMIHILDIVAADVALEQVGDEFRGICPFHRETTPSFYVVPSIGVFHCYGCGAHGDVINFIMQQRCLNFPDAVKEYERRCDAEDRGGE